MDEPAAPATDARCEKAQEEAGGGGGGRLKRAAEHVETFCAQTSIHGLKYIGERRRPWPERLVWALAFALSLGASAVLIGRAWRRWQDSPVIVAMDERLSAVWEVPFPAITICPETRVRTDLFNYTDAHLRWRWGNLSRAEEEALSYVSLLCEPLLFRGGFQFVRPSRINLLHRVAPLLNDTVFRAKWRGEHVPAAQLFQPLMTEEGLCYSFNMLHFSQLFTPDSFQGSGAYLSYGAGPEAEAEAEAEAAPGARAGAGAGEWSPDDGYAAGAGFEARPRRALGAGALLGLTVVLRLRHKDLDYLCKGPLQGFKIQLHSPAEFPRMSQQYFRAQLEQDVVVAVAPQVMRTSPELRSYLPHQRQCFLAGERRLRFFRVYSQQNCALECLANATRRACGCAPFYMPREVNETICGTASWKCVQDARDRLLRREAERGLRGDIVGQGEGEGDCDCLQSCSALAYTSERSQAHFDWARMLYATGEDVDHSHGWHMTRVHVFFREGSFVASRRSEMYGNTDFLANCGGLLGLGLGTSVLSLVELLFWLVPRALCRLRRHRPCQRSPPPTPRLPPTPSLIFKNEHRQADG